MHIQYLAYDEDQTSLDLGSPYQYDPNFRMHPSFSFERIYEKALKGLVDGFYLKSLPNHRLKMLVMSGNIQVGEIKLVSTSFVRETA